jgi:hypothetical protein
MSFMQVGAQAGLEAFQKESNEVKRKREIERGLTRHLIGVG